ncbi:MAG: hypothetical protein HGA25_09400, partial [Clostridiales bacterium]|nr:hypothetical protein [Clostridiales bacterium]
EWTDKFDTAADWIDQGRTVVARKLLCSHSGKGIVVVPGSPNTSVGLPVAKLYVLYKKKKHEYRVHVYKGNVIDVTQKKRRAGFEGRDNQIRNHQNGWVYCREGITEPADLRQLALDACTALGLHSGAVDIIWNELENKSYVLEVNSAPGIEGTTLNRYTTAILETIT